MTLIIQYSPKILLSRAYQLNYIMMIRSNVIW